MAEMYPSPTGEMAQKRRSLAPSQQAAFDAFSKAVFADGALPAKLKQIIAVAVAHVTQCPCGQNISLRLVPTQNPESQRNPGVSPAFRVLSRDRWCCAAACDFRGTSPAANCPRRSRVHPGNVG